jgi:DNA-directed RNA polymerase specialized sigma24 family protein
MQRDAKQVLTESLVLAAAAGSEEAFRELHALWDGSLRRLVRGRVERAEFADEVMTDVWLGIARGLRRLDDPACFPRWAFRIAGHKSADWVRRRVAHRRQTAALERAAEDLQPEGETEKVHEPPDDVVSLRAAIDRLQAGVAEIAEILAIPPGTVKSRLFSIRETLKQTLEPKLP